ncbi:MAG: NAD+ synthase [Candidatus Omnitrophica bacterium]|nr:NAD+ synthase [Candidatus Omnitrophota bacterium]
MAALRLALAQLNVTVGDLDANRRLIEEAIHRAQAWRADLVVVPELAVTGYPPEDLLLKPQFIEANARVLERLSPASRGLVALVGFVDRDRQGRLHNAAAVLAGGRRVATYHKQWLPNYGVFDEKRYFTAGAGSLVLMVGGVRVGVTICEDLWEEAPCRALGALGAQVVVNLSSSPYHAGKLRVRERLFARRAQENRLAIAYCNLVGGQDELIFDGASLILDARGRERIRGAQFREDMVLMDLEPPQMGPGRPSRAARGAARVVPLSRALTERPRLRLARARRLLPVEEVYEALTLGVRDYVRKNGFSTVVLGLSGGVDSALTACIAADALGPAEVRAVVMPSRFSSSATQADARRVAKALGIEVLEIPIEPMFRAYLETLQPHFGTRAPDVAEQNLQARVRGTLLMALSNKFGWLVLTTGNKSETATGYTTLYGDMAGGFAVIKDVPKTLVYELARFRNRRARPGDREPAPAFGRVGPGRRAGGPGVPIPASVLARAPSAELAPNQTDQDTLPPYSLLDRLLKAYVEEDQSLRAILARLPAALPWGTTGAAQAGNRVDPAVAQRVIAMVDRSEYKRRQGPPGIKITPKAFGKDRRMPITNRFHQS